MTLEVGFLLAVLAAMVTLFLTEKLPIDLTAFLGLAILLFTGYVGPDEAFEGFASPAVITMLAIFILSGALLETGVAEVAGGWIYRVVGGRETTLIVVVMLIAGVLSAFMNNIAATAVMMPAVASIGRRAGLSPSRLFMPLSFGAILGGTTTLVGTPPNILGAALLRDRGLEPFGLFDFTPIGAVLLATGTLYMATIGRRLLPSRELVPGDRAARDLARVYELRDNVLSLRLPAGSPLDGRTIRETGVARALGVQVVAIERAGTRILAPSPETVLRAGDALDVEGRLEDLRELERMRDVVIEEVRLADLPMPARGVGGMRGRVTSRSPMIGRTLRDLRFRERFGLTVVGIRRDDEISRERLGHESLRGGDEIFALGPRTKLEAFAERPDFEVADIGLTALRPLQEGLFLIHVPPRSSLVGLSVEESRIGELAGVAIGGLIRADQTRLAISPDETIQPDDRLLVAGEPSRIARLLELGELELRKLTEADVLESEDVGIVEAAPAPRSRVTGQTLAELDFRERYGLQVLAIWREGRPIHRDLADVGLKVGDALLLQGPHERIAMLGRDEDFLVLSPIAKVPRRTSRAPVALGALGVMVALVVSGIQPIHVAAFAGAVLVLLGGALTMDEAYRAVEWRAIFLVAAVLPVGVAMERSGTATLLADGVAGTTAALGSHAVLGALIVLASLFSQGLDGAPAVVLLAPVAFETGAALRLDPYALMMGISLAASAAFMTPFSHKANLLVMGAGGYRALDYVKVGTPLTLFLLVLMTFLVPVFFPF